MINLSTKWLGLELKNPVVVGASGLTNNIDSLMDLEKAGAGAVVLKSLFAEQIALAYDQSAKSTFSNYSEGYEYLAYFEKANIVDNYLELIRQAKAKLTIPVIASINCQNPGDWVDFAVQLEKAGAAALELNIFRLPNIGNHIEEPGDFLAILRAVKAKVSIPVALKLGSYFSNLGTTMQTISLECDGLVLFNRFYAFDIDINNRQLIDAHPYTTPADMREPLRWTSMLSGRLECPICPSTGVHDGAGLIKMLLVGANAVQMVSSVYLNGMEVIKKSLDELAVWMQKNNFVSLDDFRGQLAAASQLDQSAYERFQFIKFQSTLEH